MLMITATFSTVILKLFFITYHCVPSFVYIAYVLKQIDNAS